jgi:hypothetical protein
LAEQGFFAKEMNVGWKEWTANKHPIHAEKPAGAFCSCSKSAPVTT